MNKWMKWLPLLVIIAVLYFIAGYWTAQTDGEELSSEVDGILRKSFSKSDEDILSEIKTLAGSKKISPDEIDCQISRRETEGAGPIVNDLIGRSFPGQKTYWLSVTGSFKRRILGFSVTIPIKSQFTRTVTPPPHQNETQDAMKAALPVF